MEAARIDDARVLHMQMRRRIGRGFAYTVWWLSKSERVGLFDEVIGLSRSVMFDAYELAKCRRASVWS